MNWKNILKLLLSALLPVLYISLKLAYPDFPLTQDQFVTLILWVVGTWIGGWYARSIFDKSVLKK